jgi:hypothetical protein
LQQIVEFFFRLAPDCRLIYHRKKRKKKKEKRNTSSAQTNQELQKEKITKPEANVVY